MIAKRFRFKRKRSTKFVIHGNFDSMNKLISTTNYNKFYGNSLKQRNTKRAMLALFGQQPLKPQGNYTFRWYKSDRREDPDNIATAVKFIFDGMQEAAIIPNDNWDYIKTIHHEFYDTAAKGHEFVEIEVTWDD